MINLARFSHETADPNAPRFEWEECVRLNVLIAVMKEHKCSPGEALERIILESHDEWIEQEQLDPGSLGPMPPAYKELADAIVESHASAGLDRPQRSEDGQAKGVVATHASSAF
jgi:hypothetical protein